MNRKEQLIEVFVKENLHSLLSQKYNKRELKQRRSDFFISEKSNEVGNPKEKEIAEGLILYFLRINHLKSREEVDDLIEKSPFLSKNIHDDDFINSYFSSNQNTTVLTVDDLSSIQRKDYLHRKKEQLKEEVLDEQSKEIQEEIQKRKNQLAALPSILDSKNISEPAPSDEDDADFSDREWWQILNLRADPFPRQEGLNKIPDNLYELVIYKNKVIKEYLSRLNSNREYILNKGNLLLGGTGTGKTTLFDYLSIHFTQNQIWSLRITLKPRADIVSYREDFEYEFKSLLKEAFKNIKHSDFRISATGDDEIIELLQELKAEGWSVCVILDDLHKHKGCEETVFDFLGSLQIDKDRFIRSGVDIGFIVAGTPDWESRYRQDGYLAGFFDNAPEKIPPITAGDAYEVINRRLRAYSLHREKKDIIDRQWVAKVIRELRNEGGLLNYRIIINNIVDQLREKKFNDILSSNYQLTGATRGQIISILEEKGVRDKVERVLGGSEKKYLSNKRRILELLCELYRKGSVQEEDPTFKTHLYHYQELLKGPLIAKRKRSTDEFEWVVDPDVKSAFGKISEKFNLFPEDYLARIFLPEIQEFGSQMEASSEEMYHEISRFKQLLEERGGEVNVVSDIQDVQAIIQSTDNWKSRPLDSGTFQNIVGSWSAALGDLSKIVFHINRIPTPPKTERDAIEFWLDYWYTPDAVSEFISTIYYDQTSPTKNKLALVHSHFKDSILSILESENRMLENSSQIRIPTSLLAREEVQQFDEYRTRYTTNYLGRSYFNLVGELNNFVETKLREAINRHLQLMYGNLKNRIKMYESLARELKENGGLRYDDSNFNELENMNRGAYKKLLLESKKLRLQYFNTVFKEYDRSTLETFLDVFCDTNIDTSHLKHSQITSDEVTLVYTFLRQSIDFFTYFNRFYFDLLTEHFFFEKFEDDASSIRVWFTSKGSKDGSKVISSETSINNYKDVVPVIFTLDNLNDVYSKISRYIGNQVYLVVDLQQCEKLERKYGVSYRQFYAILAFLNYNTRNHEKFNLPLHVDRFFGNEVKVYVPT